MSFGVTPTADVIIEASALLPFV